MDSPMTLVSHPLCPYVQRVAIVLTEKGLPFERRDIDLALKPDWFLRLSPLGKTPVLQIKGAALFESAVICEYLDEAFEPKLHPKDLVLRARHRAWVAFASELLSAIAALYNAADAVRFDACSQNLHSLWGQVEAVLGEGPYFAGSPFGVVDASFAPVFRYFDTLDSLADLDFWTERPKLQRWRAALAARSSVQSAVAPDFPVLLEAFLRQRPGALGQRLRASANGD